MTDEMILRAGGQAAARASFTGICGVHDAVFSREPFAWVPSMARENADDLRETLTDPTFGLVTAEQAGELVGYAYGHRLPVDHGWWEGFPEPLHETITAEWEGRTFALISLAVLSEQRGHGIGRNLIQLLLDSRTEERAVLSVQPAAHTTQEIYRHLGWQQIGRKGPLEGVSPPHWDIYLKDPIS
jgi:ribosomal protein S18 acetylase RimI-like enzyme